MPDKNGNLREGYVNLTYHAYRNDQGEIRGVIADVQDITDLVLTRRFVEESRARLHTEQFKLETIFHQSPAAMALWRGNDLVFEKVNPEYQKIFGDRELIGKPLLDACPELRDQPFAQQLLNVLETGEGCNGHLTKPLDKTELIKTIESLTLSKKSDPLGDLKN